MTRRGEPHPLSRGAAAPPPAAGSAAASNSQTRLEVLPHLVVGSGPPVVLLPGLGPQHTGLRAHHRALQHVEVARLARSFTVWIIARPPVITTGTTIKQLGDHYADTITTLFTNPIDIIGVSTGGSIALQLAIDHPHLPSRLVLVSTAFRLGDQGRTAQQAMLDNLQLHHPRRAAATMLATTTTRPRQRTLRRAAGLALGRFAIGANPDNLIAILHAEDRFNAEADLHHVTAPTLVIGGGKDGYYPPHLFTATAAGVAHGTLAELPDHSHLDLATHKAVSRTITQYLHTAARPPAPKPGGVALSDDSLPLNSPEHAQPSPPRGHEFLTLSAALARFHASWTSDPIAGNECRAKAAVVGGLAVRASRRRRPGPGPRGG